MVKPYLWNGENYVFKMVSDLNFMNEYPNVLEWLGFFNNKNPFLAPPAIFKNVSILSTFA